MGRQDYIFMCCLHVLSTEPDIRSTKIKSLQKVDSKCILWWTMPRFPIFTPKQTSLLIPFYYEHFQAHSKYCFILIDEIIHYQASLSTSTSEAGKSSKTLVSHLFNGSESNTFLSTPICALRISEFSEIQHYLHRRLNISTLKRITPTWYHVSPNQTSVHRSSPPPAVVTQPLGD